MARIRTINPEFPQSERMGRVSREARLLFVLLWTISDDDGFLIGNPTALAKLLFPRDEDAEALINDWLDELESVGEIRRYPPIHDSILHICHFAKYTGTPLDDELADRRRRKERLS